MRKEIVVDTAYEIPVMVVFAVGNAIEKLAVVGGTEMLVGEIHKDDDALLGAVIGCLMRTGGRTAAVVVGGALKAALGSILLHVGEIGGGEGAVFLLNELAPVGSQPIVDVLIAHQLNLYFTTVGKGDNTRHTAFYGNGHNKGR